MMLELDRNVAAIARPLQAIARMSCLAPRRSYANAASVALPQGIARHAYLYNSFRF